ncbi:MAG: magnesium chelatase, partial [Streptosporangiaceae bacterium]
MVQPNSQPRHPAARHGRPPAPATLGELRADGHVYRSVKEEIRQNLLTRMRASQDRFPGIIGFDNTVLPHLERALLAGHDVILL